MTPGEWESFGILCRVPLIRKRHSSSLDKLFPRVKFTTQTSASKEISPSSSTPSLLDLDADLAKVLLVPHELVSLLGLLQCEYLVVNNRVKIIGLDTADHFLQLLP